MRTMAEDQVVVEDNNGPTSIIEPLLNDNINIIEVHKSDELIIRMPSMWEVKKYYLLRCLPVVSPTIELAAGDKVEVVEYVELVTPIFVPPNEKKKRKKNNRGHWDGLRHVRIRSTPRSLYPFKPLLFNPFYLAWSDMKYVEKRIQNLRVKNMLEEFFSNQEGDL